MIRPRSRSVMRRGRPGIGRSPNPSRPSALNRCSHCRTVLGWQPNPAPIAVVCNPAQLNVTIFARWTQSAGACLAPASLRIFCSSTASTAERAYKNMGMTLAPRVTQTLPYKPNLSPT